MAVYYLSLAVHQQPASAQVRLASPVEPGARAGLRSMNWEETQRRLKIKRVAGSMAKDLENSAALSRRRSACEPVDADAGGVGVGGAGPRVAGSHKVEMLYRSIHRARQLGRRVRTLVQRGVARFLGARDLLLSRVGSCGRANVVPARLAAFWRRLGMQAALHLTAFDLLALLLAYVFLCSLNQWAISALLNVLALYTWVLLLLECDMLVRTRVDHDGAWVELIEESGAHGGRHGGAILGAAEPAGAGWLERADARVRHGVAGTTTLREVPTSSLPPPRTPSETFEDALADSFARQGSNPILPADPMPPTNAGALHQPRVPAARGGAASMARAMYFGKLLDGGTWVRDVRSHFVGGGDAIRAVRLFWWSAVASVCGVTLTALLEPLCNDLPCLQHASACPLPYPLNHRSLGYLIDLLALLLLLAGAGAIRNVLDLERTATAEGVTASARGSQAICFSSGDFAGMPAEEAQREGSSGAALWGRARISAPNESRLAKCLGRTPIGRLLVTYRVVAAMKPTRPASLRAPGRAPPSSLY